MEIRSLINFFKVLGTINIFSKTSLAVIKLKIEEMNKFVSIEFTEIKVYKRVILLR